MRKQAEERRATRTDRRYGTPTEEPIGWWSSDGQERSKLRCTGNENEGIIHEYDEIWTLWSHAVYKYLNCSGPHIAIAAPRPPCA